VCVVRLHLCLYIDTSWPTCTDGLCPSNITRDPQMACTTADYDWSKRHANRQLLLRHTDLFIHNINLWLFNANYVCVLFSMLYGACYVLAITGPYMCCDLHTHTHIPTHQPLIGWHSSVCQSHNRDTCVTDLHDVSVNYPNN
jgi:hypothetical protein